MTSIFPPSNGVTLEIEYFAIKVQELGSMLLSGQLVRLNVQLYALMRLKDLDNLQNIFSPWVAARSEHAVNALT